VDIEDIAHALSQMPRHGGHCLRKISVAQHCVMVHDLLADGGYGSEVAFAGLMHDAEEAYILDMPKPLKMAPELAAYCDLGRKIRRVVFERYGVSDLWSDIVKHADHIAVLAEIFQWKRNAGAHLEMDPAEVSQLPTILPWTEVASHFEFMDRFNRHRRQSCTTAENVSNSQPGLYEMPPAENLGSNWSAPSPCAGSASG
jgi:5'-deoxynucleotidase YfbR-like HD superfamily hydrolase